MAVTLALLLQATDSRNPLVSFLPLILIFGIFYLLLILPMQRQRKKQAKMLSELQNGNVVITSGGIVGTIVAVNDDDTLHIRVKPDNVKIQVTRQAVSAMVPPEEKAKS